MLQVVLIILIAVAVVAGGVWLSANPGSMNLEWLGWQVETNIIVALIAIGVLFVALYVVLWIVGALAGLFGLRVAGTPGNLRSALRGLSEGYAAIRAGKGAEARVEAKRAAWGRKDRARSPGALMVADGTAMDGDVAGARALYKELLEVPECEAGALRGLLELAIMDGDDDGIRDYCERALFKVDKRSGRRAPPSIWHSGPIPSTRPSTPFRFWKPPPRPRPPTSAVCAPTPSWRRPVRPKLPARPVTP